MTFLRRNPVLPRVTQTPAAATLASPQADGRTAPEPLTIVLPVLAALGAIASIAAVAWVAQDREGDRPRVKRRIDVILKDLETSCLGIIEILKRVRRHAKVLGLDGASGAAVLKLGLNSGRVDPAGGQVYHQLINDLATMLVLATQNSFDAINAIEDGEIDAPEEVFYRFGDAQEKLNRLLIQRVGLRITIDACSEVALQLAGLIQELMRHKKGSGG